MITRLTALITLASLVGSCSGSASPPPIQTHSLPQPNPTSYSFPLPLQEFRTKALQAFSVDHQIDRPIFGKQQSSASAGADFLQHILQVECSTNAIFGEAVFRDPADTNDIYLHSFDTPFTLSPIYYGRSGSLPFIAAFHLHLIPSGTNTLVKITALDTEVINGTKFGFGPCGPGKAFVLESVQPTTVEEYTILHYLGEYLGVTNMPPIILPKP